MIVTIPVSTGELLDKITILQIKQERIEDSYKKQNVSRELKELTTVQENNSLNTQELLAMFNELKKVNESLWDIEEGIRVEERNNNFGEEFIRLARAVYITNDKRAEIKKNINLKTGSVLIEEKSY